MVDITIPVTSWKYQMDHGDISAFMSGIFSAYFGYRLWIHHAWPHHNHTMFGFHSTTTNHRLISRSSPSTLAQDSLQKSATSRQLAAVVRHFNNTKPFSYRDWVIESPIRTFKFPPRWTKWAWWQLAIPACGILNHPTGPMKRPTGHHCHSLCWFIRIILRLGPVLRGIGSLISWLQWSIMGMLV